MADMLEGDGTSMSELTDDDFRRRPDPAKQLRLAAAGKIGRGPGTVRHDAEHGRILCGPVAAIGKPLIEVFAEEAGEKPKRRRGMNKTEAEWAAVLEQEKRAGVIRWYAFEAITLKLADDCRYTPDFAVFTLQGNVRFFEVKGFFREDAKVKVRVAVAMFPWASFFVVRKKRKRDGGGWEVQAF